MSVETADREKTSADKATALAPRSSWLRRQFSDVLHVVKRDKKWLYLPLLVFLLILTALLLTATVMGPLAPFVYPLL